MITTLPPSPLRTETPQVFADKADALLGALPNFVTELNAMGTAFNLATTATSTTSNVIGTGDKTFTVATGLGFQSGMTVVIANTGTPANSMYGQVVSYSGASLVVSVATVTGSGTFTAWTISLAVARLTNSGLKNFVVNGNFEVWQRGDSFGAGFILSADRWILAGAAGQTATKVMDHPLWWYGYCMEISNTSGVEWAITRIAADDVKPLIAQTVTLSTWFKNISGNKNIQLIAESANGYNIFSAPATIGGKSTVIASAGVWTQLTYTFTVPIAASNGLQFRAVTSAGVGGASVCRITAIQLELGGTSTTLESRPLSLERFLAGKVSDTSGAGFLPYDVNDGSYGISTSTTITPERMNTNVWSNESTPITITLPLAASVLTGTTFKYSNLGSGLTTISSSAIYALGLQGASTVEVNCGETIWLTANDGGAWVQSSASSKTKQVQYRQAVQYGPAAATGQADLIPQSQVGNTLATGVTLKCSTKATSFSVGQGFYADGTQKNITRVTSTDVTIPSLNASTTLMVCLDVNAGTGFLAAAADIWQYGGTPSIANGQLTYDYLNHIMYYGNGTTATPSPYIVVAEVDTNATVVTAIRCRAYAGQYDSGFTATLVGAAGTYTKNHNMGTKEITVVETIECTTADAGYAVGDTLDNVQGTNATYAYNASVIKNKNTVVMRRPAGGSAYLIPNVTTGVGAAATATSWKYKLTVKRNF